MRIISPAIAIVLGIIFSTSLTTSNLSAQVESQVLAPGVLKVIKPSIDSRDSNSLPMVTPQLNAIEFDPFETPKTDTLWQQSRKVTLFRDVWQYEFAFLGLRQIELDVEVEEGYTVKRNFWYMVYRLRNTGEVVTNEVVNDPKFKDPLVEKRYNFRDMTPENKQALVDKLKQETLYGTILTNFRLEGWVEDITTRRYTRVKYSQVFSPDVIRRIRELEDPGTELLNSVDMLKKSLPIVDPRSKYGGVWGVAVWEGVDPRIDYVSCYVNGLTNAYRLKHQPDGTIDTVQKTLQLNFYRAGDSIAQSDDVVDYGVPLYDDFRQQIEVCYRYNLPGPVFQAFDVNQETTRRAQIFEIDGGVNLSTLRSGMARELGEGSIPEPVLNAFKNSGMALPDGSVPRTTIPGSQWEIRANIDGLDKVILIDLTPRFWARERAGGIKFTNSLEHLWIYQ